MQPNPTKSIYALDLIKLKYIFHDYIYIYIYILILIPIMARYYILRLDK
ncbi:MAG: hypothetical protein N7Q72_05230 [Spiroplasma sp. Tabriz.8]|nr:hypothetical protein [Spiroplasma sp. Tabriz.8]